MNAKWLEKFAEYRNTKNGFDLSQKFIYQKIFYQFKILKDLESGEKYLNKAFGLKNKQELLLLEARASKEYWKKFGLIIDKKSKWLGRNAHNKDIVNKLLDIGYHYLVSHLVKIFKECDVPTELGILHKAQSKSSNPLIYDFMEWARPSVVDKNLITFLRKKKNKLEKIEKSDVKKFLFLVKKNFNIDFYNRKLKYCISLDYWIKLLVLEIRGAVSQNREVKLFFPSLRHETRCKIKKPPTSDGL
jgi:CRISPR-associated endonuclease Cas1